MAILYHNPRCSTSRNALEMLKQKGVEPEILLYLETPPSADTLDKLLKQLKMEPRALMRTKEKEYKELGLDNPKLSRNALIQAMVQHPILIERPIFVHKGKAVLGRPAERVLEIV